jgi:hypothetical protein
MAYVDEMKSSTHDDIKDLACKHSTWNEFWQDVQRLAEKAWHNARSQNEQDQSVQPTPAPGQNKADEELTPGPTGEPAEGAQVEAGPTDEGQPVTTPAEPASPVSDGGFPTTNVGVVVSENEGEGTPVPVEESHPAS